MRNQFPQSITDYQGAVEHFNEELIADGSWSEVSRTSVGAFIKRMVAGSHMSQMYAISVAARNGFFRTALRDSAIYDLLASAGVTITGKTPASVTAYMEAATSIEVPAWTPHVINGIPFFNRNTYFSNSSVELTQGSVGVRTFNLLPDVFEYKLDTSDFSVSDIYVWVTDTLGAVYDFSEGKGFFNYTADDRVYFRSYSGAGDVILLFGDGEYGAALGQGTLNVRYVSSLGSEGNGLISGTRVTTSLGVNGRTTDVSAGGSDPRDADYYRQYGPHMIQSRKKSAPAIEIKADLLLYSGVADVTVLTQRDVAPHDPTWKNTLRIVALPVQGDTFGGANPNPSSAAWSQIREYVEKTVGAMEVQTFNPNKYLISVAVRLVIFEWAYGNASSLVAQARENIIALFRKRPGILGRPFTRSDIEKSCALDGVDYAVVLSPTEEVITPDNVSYCTLVTTPNVTYTKSRRADESA